MKIVKRLTLLAVVCAVLPACSSNMTRFDYPVMGMNSDPKVESYENSRDKYAQTYDRSTNDYSKRRNYAPDYNYKNKRSSENEYRPTYTYKKSYDQTQQRYLDQQGDRGRDVYDTASTDNPYKRQTETNNQPRYRYTDDYRQTGLKRKELPDIALKEKTPSGRKDALGYHIVGEGDTLYNISRRYRVTTEQIRRANQFDGNDIKLGQKLYIPGVSKGALPKKDKVTASLGKSTKYHTVAKGDTVYNISRRYGVTRQGLADANGLEDLSQVKLGQRLVIPHDGVQKTPVKVASIDRKAGLKQSYKKQDIAVPKRKVDAKKSYKIKSVDSGVRSKLATKHNFVWPANGRIISKFGRQKSGTINDGLNLALPKGTKIKAAEAGVVAYAGSELKGYGNLVLIRHADNWVTAYAHNSKLLVKRGEKVRRGQVIAKSGKSGSVHQPQLHFELRKGSKPVNPMKYLAMR